MTVEDVVIRNRGVVATGRVEGGRGRRVSSDRTDGFRRLIFGSR
jgi:translation elongation factor EF-Tu-like GTPase